MSLEYYIDLARIVDLTMMILMIILFVKNWERDQNVKIGILYLVCLLFYLLVSWKLVYESPLFYIVIIGDLSIPILFWYLSKSIFDDNFKLGKTHVLLYLSIVVVNYYLFYLNYWVEQNSNIWIAYLIRHFSQMTSLAFVILAIVEAFRNRSVDLLESRIKLRAAFILIAGSLNVLTLVITISGNWDANKDFFNLFQIIAIGIILILVFFYLVEFKPGFFFEKPKEIVEVQKPDPKISEAINHLINVEKIYLEEGLTIKKLADQMNEQEYKVRRYINKFLKFKNFNDFLNSYRIQNACEILLDESKANLSVLEIAYSLGYNSLGPFNKAFKNHTGTTPTSFRKKD